MKILQINVVYNEKSTGRTCKEVENVLIQLGHQCITAYGYGNHSDPNTYKIGSKVEYYFHNLMSRITGLEGYFSFFATKRLITFIKKYNPDIIHLRNLHGHYLNLPLLFSFLRTYNKPVIQNLHDMWAITGKCCYYSERKCEKWKVLCHSCEAKKDYPTSLFFDFSKKMFLDKKKWYSGINKLTVIGVSKWVMDEAKESFLNSCSNDINFIYNWINLSNFKKLNNVDEIKHKYNIPLDKKIILGVSASWNEGTPRYEDFKKLEKLIKDDELIVLVGKGKKNLSTKRIIHIQFTNNVKELCEIYNIALVYVHCSIEDTFGKVIAEAQACGTPAIVYNTTGCKEIVVDFETGYVVDARNVDAIREKIDVIKSNGKDFYAEKCIFNAKSRFNFKLNSAKLIEVYENAEK